MTITLHHVPFSRSFRVLWMLEELGLDAKVVVHSIRKGTMRTPEVLAISPAAPKKAAKTKKEESNEEASKKPMPTRILCSYSVEAKPEQ